MEPVLGWLCEEALPSAEADHIRAVIEEGRTELERVSNPGGLGGTNRAGEGEWLGDPRNTKRAAAWFWESGVEK